ncbi:MAG: M23 family metallopeptidase [Treponema sp.]|nr:M23 family metallopeptidase [Treponema sp.]
MARTHTYKKLEKNVALRIQSGVILAANAVASFFVWLFRLLDSKMTVMIVPHSGKKSINFQTNIFALSLGSIIVVGICISFFYFNNKSIGETAEINRLMTEHRETLASLDELRDENVHLLKTARHFQASLSQSLSLLGIERSRPTAGVSSNASDLAALFDMQDTVSGSIRESAGVRELTNYLDGAVQPIEQLGKMLENQSNLFKEIPSIWPTSNMNAHFSMPFGPAIHPITGQWYIHRGLDFSTYRSGDPVVATADGQVVSIGYDPSFGNNIVLRHKHGIYTRYAHLSTMRVSRGQIVQQRDVIGYIGNTGVTTGPHLHYEVHIGSDVVDPAQYINIKFSN